MSDIDFMGYKCTFHVDTDSKIHYEHNIRDPKLVKHEKHIDPTKKSEVTLNLGHMETAYETVFGDYVKEYNKGLRKDRQIKKYLELVRKDARRGKHLNQKADGSRKPAYEAIIQIGNRDNQPDPESSLRILKLFVEKWIPQHYPNIQPILIAYHADEFSIDRTTKEKIPSPVHCHLDFIYIAHCLTAEELKKEEEYREEAKKKKMEELRLKNKKFDEELWKQKDWKDDMIKRTGKSLTKGMQIQASMSSALREMGFKSGNGTTAQILFEEQVRHDLQDFAEAMGLKIDRTPGERHKHDTKSVYQEKQELKRQQKEWKNTKEKEELELKKQKVEIEKQSNSLQQQIKAYQQAEDGLKKKEKELAKKETELSVFSTVMERNSNLAASYAQIVEEVTINKKAIERLENDFLKPSSESNLRTKMEAFANGCKKIITSLATQLSKYKQAFEHFWKWKPKQFRELADSMERMNCQNYELYFEKKRFEQIQPHNNELTNTTHKR